MEQYIVAKTSSYKELNFPAPSPINNSDKYFWYHTTISQQGQKLSPGLRVISPTELRGWHTQLIDLLLWTWTV